MRDARADRDGLRVAAGQGHDRQASATACARQLNRASRRVTRAEREVAELNTPSSYATVDLSIAGDAQHRRRATPGDRWTPGDALKDAGRVLEVIAGVLVIGLAILLPIAILVALAALRQPRPHPPSPRAGARSVVTQRTCARRPGVVDTPE